MTKLSLIVPCYNEQETLESCIKRVMELKDDSLDLEIIIVDDCSTDNSIAIANKLVAEYPEISVFSHEINMGKGAALRTGFLKATGDYVGIQDADTEYDPLDYRKLLIPLLEGRADVVCGSRYLRPDTRRVLYFWHSQMNRVLTFLSNMFTDLGITDMETCYKLFKRSVIQDIAPQLQENRFGFEPEVIALVAEKKCRVYECAISYTPRSFEEGKKIGWRDGVRALYCIFHYGAHRAPVPMQLLIYFFIGLVCAITNISLFTIFIQEFSMVISVAAAFFLAAALNYFLCSQILFRHTARWTAKKEVFVYTLGIAAMWGVDYLCTAAFFALGVDLIWSKIWATGIGFVGNFLLRKYLVF